MRAKQGSSTAAAAALAEQAASTAAAPESGSIFPLPLPGAPPPRAAPRRGARRGRAAASAAVVEAVAEVVAADVKGEAEPAEAAGPLPAAAPAAKKRGRAPAAVKKEAAAAAGVDASLKPEAEAVAAGVKGVAEPPEAAGLLPVAASAAKKRGRAPAAVKKEAAAAAGADVSVKPEADAPPSPAPAPPRRAARAKRGAKAGAPAGAAGAAYEAALAAVAAGEALAEVVVTAPAAKRRRGKAAKAGAEAAGAAADPEYAADEEAEAAVKKPRKRYYPKKREPVKAEGEGAEGGAGAEAGDGEEKKKPRRKKREQTGPVYEIPGPEALERALAAPAARRPVPNLGYACLNMDLREQRPPIYTNRDCIKKTWDEKGLPWVSGLVLENTRALAALVQWNWEHDIHFFRMSSTIFPWCTEYRVDDLPDIAGIRAHLKFAGDLARAYGQRLTFHPSHFVKLATADEALLCKSLHELEVHSQVFDMMGYEPSHWNKINIHVGGVYGDKVTSLERFAAGFRRLSPACQKRLTVENDDIANSYSLEDLLTLHKDIRVPLVFDFHHHKFCPGSLTEEQAVRAAIATWPPGVRPVVHWSESQEGRKAHAHSDYVDGPMNLHGLEKDIDVMIEAKCKERALLRFRALSAAPPSADAVMAGKLLDL